MLQLAFDEQKNKYPDKAFDQKKKKTDEAYFFKVGFYFGGVSQSGYKIKKDPAVV
jgi:hypothetical protein